MWNNLDLDLLRVRVRLSQSWRMPNASDADAKGWRDHDYFTYTLSKPLLRIIYSWSTLLPERYISSICPH
jgi:hypothetical protein